MKIRVKLMGILKDRTPPGDQIELPTESTISDALLVLEIPVDSVQVFTVNGELQREKSYLLADQDELTVLPPVGGG